MKARVKKTLADIPDIADIETELKREKYKNQYSVVLRSTIYTLITVAAVAILVATLWLPVLQIYGESMTPTLQDGDIVLSLKGEKFCHRRCDCLLLQQQNFGEAGYRQLRRLGRHRRRWRCLCQRAGTGRTLSG